MSGPAAMVWAALIGAMAFGLVQIKLAVQPAEEEFARLSRDLLASEEAIHVLRAEWSYLNRPERLADLAERHLDLEPVGPGQLVAFDPWLEKAPNRSAAELGRKISSGRTEP